MNMQSQAKLMHGIGCMRMMDINRNLNFVRAWTSYNTLDWLRSCPKKRPS
jgi:hypothetical protein